MDTFAGLPTGPRRVNNRRSDRIGCRAGADLVGGGRAGPARRAACAGRVLTQFFIFGIQAGIVLRLIWPGYAWGGGFAWYAGLTSLATQVLIGYGIARYGKARALGICLLVVATDCLVGFRVNNVSISMAIWAVPLLAGTLVASRRRVVRA